jgi:hypothetical protein
MKIKLDNAHNIVGKLLLQSSISELKDRELLLEASDVIIDLTGEILDLIKTQNELFRIAEKAIDVIDASTIPEIRILLTQMYEKLSEQQVLKNKQSNAGKNRHKSTIVHKKLNIIQEEYQARYDNNKNWLKLNGRLKEFMQEMAIKHSLDIDQIKPRITKYRKEQGHSASKR